MQSFKEARLSKPNHNQPRDWALHSTAQHWAQPLSPCKTTIGNNLARCPVPSSAQPGTAATPTQSTTTPRKCFLGLGPNLFSQFPSSRPDSVFQGHTQHEEHHLSEVGAFPAPSQAVPGLALFSRWPGFLRSPNLPWAGFFGSSLISQLKAAACLSLGSSSLILVSNCLQAESSGDYKAHFIVIPFLRHHNCAPPVVRCLGEKSSFMYFMYPVQLSNCSQWEVKSRPCYHTMEVPTTYICDFESYFWAFFRDPSSWESHQNVWSGSSPKGFLCLNLYRCWHICYHLILTILLRWVLLPPFIRWGNQAWRD